jgi:signal transduction histidine kinase/CheY-like chemotaxis protein/PAS domain-containing protein
VLGFKLKPDFKNGLQLSGAPMLEKIFKKLIPEHMQGSVLQYSYAANAVGCALIVLLLNPIFAIVYYFFDFPAGSIALLIEGSVIIAAVLSMKYLSLCIVREIIALAIYIFMVWEAYHLGGVSSSVSYWLVLPALAVTMMGGKKSSLIWCVICIATVIVFYLLKHFNYPLPPSSITDPLLLKAFSMIGLIVCLLYVGYFFERGKREGAKEIQQTNLQLQIAKEDSENLAKIAKNASLAKSVVIGKLSEEVRAFANEEALMHLMVLRSAPDLYLILTPEFQIVEVTETYLKATMTQRLEIIGRGIFEVFPENPEDLSSKGVLNLVASLESVLVNKKTHAMAIQKYDIRRPKAQGGKFEVRYWSPVNIPVLDMHGDVKYIIHRVEDVTSYVKLKKDGAAHKRREAELLSNAVVMEGEIFRRAQELQEANKHLETAREHAENLARKAQEASRAKSTFLSTMSHETRTPLNGVLGMAGLLLDSKLSAEQHEWVEVISKSGEDLLSIINNILEFSKIESEYSSLENSDFVLKILVNDVLELISSETRKKNILVITNISENIPSALTGDASRLRQILSILLINAMKFTEEGKITTNIKVQEIDGLEYNLLFEVIDTGVGLAPGVREKLFVEFSQGDASASRKFGGTGLGLAIAKRLVESMGGKIDVESQSTQGCRFWFTLNLTECDKPIANIIGEKNRACRDLSGNNKNLKKSRLLLAEDNPMNQKVSKLILNKLGYHVDVVGNGIEVIHAIQTVPYDLILMDCEMPEMDGYAASKEIRKFERQQNLKKHIPIIALTSYVLQEDRDKCITAGMDDFLAKPVNKDILASILEIWLSQEKDA